MAHHTKDKGDLAVAKVIAHLLEHNIRVCRPLSEHLPFDFIAVMPDMCTLRRVQVKYREARDGAVHVVFRSNYYDSKK
ncbi:MAG: group I intron-associated PD-(D/E)XK endonuclease, partial [Acidobacteriales bacterium]|nr:group I intron-associated PD-(D/E)XK endonuclease [Terriglobales bacterium]